VRNGADKHFSGVNERGVQDANRCHIYELQPQPYVKQGDKEMLLVPIYFI
jgi:hypothetical protein